MRLAEVSEHRSISYRLHPTRKQHRALERILEDQRHLHNAALQERLDCYRKTGRGIGYQAQCRSLAPIRRDDPTGLGAVPANLSRATLRRLDLSFAAFFRRVKAGEKPGFPRFKGAGRWDSFGFAEFSGIQFASERLRFKGMPGSIRVHMTRPLAGRILACTFRRDAKGWRITLQVQIEAPATNHAGPAIGLDVGISALATLSSGERIENIKPRRSDAAAIRRRQRSLARCKRSSARRRKVRRQLARAHSKVANTRATYLHQVSANLTKRFGLIAVEALNVKGLARGMLAHDVHDAAWARLLHMLSYKAASAGGRVIEVDPRHTSQACSSCGVITPKTLADRTHKCDCGLVLDRDHNAALNILHRAVAGPGLVNVGDCAERGAGNIAQARGHRLADRWTTTPLPPSGNGDSNG